MFPRAKRVSLGLAQPGDSPLYGTYIELAHASENSAFVIADEIRRFHSNFDCFRFGSHPVHPSARASALLTGGANQFAGGNCPRRQLTRYQFFFCCHRLSFGARCCLSVVAEEVQSMGFSGQEPFLMFLSM